MLHAYDIYRLGNRPYTGRNIFDGIGHPTQEEL